MSLSPNAKSPCASTAGPICPSSSHRISSKKRPPFLGGMDSPCASSNKALTWPTRQANSDPWKSRLDFDFADQLVSALEPCGFVPSIEQETDADAPFGNVIETSPS